MQLIEAAHLLIELVEKCKNLNGSSFSLMPPQPLQTLFEGYKLHILKGNRIEQETEKCVEEIIARHGLSVKVEEEGFLIYRKR